LVPQTAKRGLVLRTGKETAFFAGADFAGAGQGSSAVSRDGRLLTFVAQPEDPE